MLLHGRQKKGAEHMEFTDRHDAGRQLAAALERYRGATDAVVLGVPRGGVVVAAQVAEALRLPLDIVVTRKIGAPGNPEYAVAAVDGDGTVTVGFVAGVPEGYLERAATTEQAEVARRVAAYRGGRPVLDLAGKTALVVDDGIATGLTLRAAVSYLRRSGAKRVVIAAPVAAPDSAARLRQEADDVVTLAEPPGFSAVGQFYERFDQTSDAEVRALLQN
jgi:putative phosphoribosyl transferase